MEARQLIFAQDVAGGEPSVFVEARQLILAQDVAGGEPSVEMTARVVEDNSRLVILSAETASLREAVLESKDPYHHQEAESRELFVAPASCRPYGAGGTPTTTAGGTPALRKSFTVRVSRE